MCRAIRILLVDDEDVIHATLGVYLNSCGHHVDSALDGSQALEAVASEHDLVIVDCRLPRVDGLTVLKTVKDKHPHVPVIMISGHGDDDLQDEASRLGASAFLIKPFPLRQIEELARELTAGAES